MKISNKISCFLTFHSWTSKVIQGVKPKGQYTSMQDFVIETNDLLKVYCSRCGHVSPLSKAFELRQTININEDN
jgi:hypothetical protein